MSDAANDPNATIPRGRLAQPIASEPSRETMIERRRVRRVEGLRPYAAALFIVLAAISLGGELARNWFRGSPIGFGAVGIGAIFGFVGFYLLDRSDAKDAGQFLVGATVSLVTAVRGGRRATDPPVAVPTPPAEVPPAASAANPPHPSSEG